MLAMRQQKTILELCAALSPPCDLPSTVYIAILGNPERIFMDLSIPAAVGWDTGIFASTIFCCV